MALIIANITGFKANVTSAHYELELGKKRLEQFKLLSSEDQLEYLEEQGLLMVDDIHIIDSGLVKLNESLDSNIAENEKQVSSLQEEIIQLDLLKGQHKKVILNIDAFLNN